MSNAPYNGYSWKQRERILKAYQRGEAGPEFSFAELPCGMCGDPDRSPTEWHSEDYSEPFTFMPPQTYPLCKSCHARLHKRFNAAPEEWELFCLHLEAGGYGSEFVERYPISSRRIVCQKLRDCETVDVASIRSVAGRDPWWRKLTLDPESLRAPWARPRPLRPRPDAAAYRSAFDRASLTPQERKLLRCHASTFRRTATMRSLAQKAFDSESAQRVNLAYGRLAHRVANHLDWTPDRRADDSPIWMSVIAEGWQPSVQNAEAREFEWTMVAMVAEIWRDQD